MLNRRRERQTGSTLVELLVASLIGLIALSAIVTSYAATSRHGRQQLQAAHLEQQLRGILNLISDDIRRAGFWQFDPRVDSPSANPFQRNAHRLRLGAAANEPAASCVLFSYDLDRDGKLGVGRCAKKQSPADSDCDNVEQLGFRLRNGSVQSRYGGRTFACNSGYWQALNDRSIVISKLHFSLTQRCASLTGGQQTCSTDQSRLLQTAIQIELTGHIHRQPQVTRKLSQWVRVRNDRLTEI